MKLIYLVAIALLVGFALFGCTQNSEYKEQPNMSGKPTNPGATEKSISDSDLSVLDISPSEPDAGEELGMETLQVE